MSTPRRDRVVNPDDIGVKLLSCGCRVTCEPRGDWLHVPDIEFCQQHEAPATHEPCQRWIKNPDGEYNEQSAQIGPVAVTLYSDRDGERWTATFNEGEPVDLEATDLYAARREAESRAREMA